MHQNHLDIISEIFGDDFKPDEISLKFFTQEDISKYLQKSGADNINYVDMLSYDVERGFSGSSIYLDEIQGHNPQEFSKSSYYRFKDDEDIDWKKFETETALEQIRKIPKASNLSREARKAIGEGILIIDDTPFERTRSKKSELSTWCFDHCKNKNYRGYRLLVLCWSNGEVTIPICAIFFSTAKENKEKVQSHEVRPGSPGERARKDAQREMPEVVRELIAYLAEAGIPFDHVVADTWFTNRELMKKVKSLGKNYTGRVKNQPKYQYKYRGHFLSAQEILKKNGGVPHHKKGVSGCFLKVPITLEWEVQVKKGTRGKKGSAVYRTERLKGYLLFCYNDRSEDEESFILILSTLPAKKRKAIVYIYSVRWQIEVFFHVAKVYLGLVKDTRVISLDSLNEHIGAVFLRYRLLVYEDLRNPGDCSLIERLYLLSKESLGSYWYNLFHDFFTAFCLELLNLGVDVKLP